MCTFAAAIQSFEGTPGRECSAHRHRTRSCFLLVCSLRRNEPANSRNVVVAEFELTLLELNESPARCGASLYVLNEAL